jgi:hypothetical protein
MTPPGQSDTRSMEQVLTDARKIEEEFARQNRTATVRVDDLERVMTLAFAGFGVADLDAEDHGLLSRFKAAIGDGR